MRSALLTLLTALSPFQTPLVAQDGASPPLVCVRGEDGFRTLGVWSPRLRAPLSSRSERVVRAHRTRRGLGIRLFAGTRGPARLDSITVRAVPHAAGEQVLLGDDGVPYLFGPPVLPRSVETESGDLAWLARQDGNWIEGDGLTLGPPADSEGITNLVLIAATREEHPTQARLVALPSLSVWTTELDGPGWIDQAFYATARELDPAGFPTCELRSGTRRKGRTEGWESEGAGFLPFPRVQAAEGGESLNAETLAALAGGDGVMTEVGTSELLDLWFAPPEASGETHTLLVELDLEWTGEESEWGPAAASARRAGDGGWLRDVTTEAGVAMVHFEGPDEQLDIGPTMGPGAAWGDVDGDGWMDLYLVQGGGREGSEALPNRLFRNLGNGRFDDVTAAAQIGDEGAGMGALFFDVDGDADVDLYVSNYGADVLYVNDGQGVFEDVSAAWSVGGELWSAGICAADHDLDGDLDVYVTSYLKFDLELMPPAEELGRYEREDPVAMLPFAFPGERNVFLRNEGAGFEDVTKALGVLDEAGRGMQATFWDFDQDGDEDLYVANDVSMNVLFRNEGDGSFKDISFSTGLDDPRGGMGLALGDVDLDGDEDMFLTNWQLEANALYLNNSVSARSAKHRRATFRDATVGAGLGPASIGVTSWGAELFDSDNDGDLDLFIANGYTSPDYESTGICVGQPNLYFENDGEGRFVDRSEEAGHAVAVKLASRAAVACDYDQDGRVDMVVTANNGRVQLLRNEGESGNWLGIRLRGEGGNTLGIGARVKVRGGGLEQTRTLRAGQSYLGGNPAELHFGLGDAESVDEVEVRWPSGEVTTHGVEVNRYVTLRERE